MVEKCVDEVSRNRSENVFGDFKQIGKREGNMGERQKRIIKLLISLKIVKGYLFKYDFLLYGTEFKYFL